MTPRPSLFGALVTAMNAVGTCLVLLMMCVILVDVFGRFMFNAPLRGTPEIVAISIVAIVYLQFPSTLRAGRVISADGLLGWIAARSVRAEQCIEAVFHATGGAMFTLVCAYAAPLALDLYDDGDYYGTPNSFAFPKWPVYAVVAFGCAVMALQYFILAWNFVRSARRNVRLLNIDPSTKVLS